MSNTKLQQSDARRAGWSGMANALLAAFRRLARNRAALVSGIVLLILIVVTLTPLNQLIAPYDPAQMGAGAQLVGPSSQNLFGTDQYGRDLFSRTIYGGQLTLTTSLFGVALAAVVGVLAGLVAGYREDWVGSVIMRLIDVMLAFPGILLTLAVVAVLGPGLSNIQIAIGVSLIPPFVRLVHGSVLSAKHNDYVESAVTLGCSPMRVMIRHILPNIMGPIVVLFTTALGWAIITASSLSFLGLGVNPPTPEWGADLRAALTYLNQAWWLVFPGAAITIAILVVNLFGDGLGDALDPYTAKR